MGFIMVTTKHVDRDGEHDIRIMLNTDNISGVVELPDDRCLVILRHTIVGRVSIEPNESFGLIRGRLAMESDE